MIGSVIARFARERAQILRTSGYYSGGLYHRREETPILVMTGTRPARASDVERLEEGARLDGARVFYGFFVLSPDGCRLTGQVLEPRLTDTPESLADRVVWDGRVYEFADRAKWGQHSRYVALVAEQ